MYVPHFPIYRILARQTWSVNNMFFTFMDFSKWEPEDDEKLLEAVKICGIGPWETGILQYFFH